MKYDHRREKKDDGKRLKKNRIRENPIPISGKFVNIFYNFVFRDFFFSFSNLQFDSFEANSDKFEGNKINNISFINFTLSKLQIFSLRNQNFQKKKKIIHQRLHEHER